LLLIKPRAFLDSGINNIFHWPLYIEGAQFRAGTMAKALEPSLTHFHLVNFAQNIVWLPMAGGLLLLGVNLSQQIVAQYRQGKRLLPFGIVVTAAFIIWLLFSERYAGFGVIGIAIILASIVAVTLIRNQNQQLTIAATLALSLLLLMFMQSLKNFYETSIVWPIFLLIVIFSFSKVSTWGNRILIWLVLPILFIGAIVSSYARSELTGEYAAAWRNSRAEKIILQSQLKQFAKEACNISDISQGLVLDDDTYPSFWQNSKPMLTAYVYGWWSQGTNYQQTLANQIPQGLVTKCESAPPELLKVLTRQGEYCCASETTLRQYILDNRPQNTQ
jgi:hypothetical protein